LREVAEKAFPISIAVEKKGVWFCAGIRTAFAFHDAFRQVHPHLVGKGWTGAGYLMWQITTRLNLRRGATAQERVLESMRERPTI